MHLYLKFNTWIVYKKEWQLNWKKDLLIFLKMWKIDQVNLTLIKKDFKYTMKEDWYFKKNLNKKPEHLNLMHLVIVFSWINLHKYYFPLVLNLQMKYNLIEVDIWLYKINMGIKNGV